MKTAFEELGPAFERETGHRLKLTFGPSLQLEKRLAEGEGADVAITASAVPEVSSGSLSRGAKPRSAFSRWLS
jgi:ABC-type molybdate transport system substrate-binding protein